MKMLIKGCSGNCMQGRLECDCENAKTLKISDSVNLILIIFFVICFMIGFLMENV